MVAKLLSVSQFFSLSDKSFVMWLLGHSRWLLGCHYAVSMVLGVVAWVLLCCFEAILGGC